jgi:hypothetical protein
LWGFEIWGKLRNFGENSRVAAKIGDILWGITGNLRKLGNNGEFQGNCEKIDMKFCGVSHLEPIETVKF